MYKYFTANNTKTWINIIDDLLYNYNKSYHRSIQMTTSEASLVKNSKVVYNYLFPKEITPKKVPRYKLSRG